MKTATGFILGVLAAVATAAGGYWIGQRTQAPAVQAEMKAPAPVATGEKKRRVLYYRNPMGLPDTSLTPKKDAMGMDYAPVYEGEQADGPASASVIRISTEKVQKLGVRTEAVSRHRLERTIRAAGRIAPDERRVYAISPKFEGYVERLDVNVTGQPVAKGQPLFEVYSPQMVEAQGDYAVAARGLQAQKDSSDKPVRDLQGVVDASLLRLKNWDMPEDQIRALVATGQVMRTLTFRSPVNGVVTDKKALQGMRFSPGDALYQVTDLSTVWVIADVYEQDIESVKAGDRARVKIAAYPEKTFAGTITYVYPTLTAETRTIPVRIELSNPGRLLKPAMFAQVEVPVAAKGSVLVVPASAVIDSGTRRIVLVQSGDGRFEPREVRVGQRGDDFVELLDGVREQERVVVAANFLIDAESNLKAAIGGFAAAAGATAAPAMAGGTAGELGTSGLAQTGPVGHKGEGTIHELDAGAGTVSIGHGPIEALRMPAMTMEFRVANDTLLTGLRPGEAVDFEFVERKPGEWVITRITPVASPRGGGQEMVDAHGRH